MRISVKAKPGAKREEVVAAEGYFVVSVTEPPREGRANRAIIRALAEYFNVPASSVRIVTGFTSREKVVEVDS